MSFSFKATIGFLATAVAHDNRSAGLPAPVSFWTFQEPTGAPRVSTGAFAYSLVDGNSSLPVLQVSSGVFGQYAAYIPYNSANNSVRLFAARDDVPALTKAIAGPNATVSTVSWIRRSATDSTAEAMVVGVWNEHMAARQYALFTALGACSSAPVYHAGLAAHISDTGGPTPGNKYCITRACDPEPLPANAWHCLAGVYDGQNIYAYVNGTLHPNANATRQDNPFHYPGGIFDPEATGHFGAEFAVGGNMINRTVGGPALWSNSYNGMIGGLGVWNTSLTAQQIAAVCASAQGFEHLAVGDVQRWAVPT